VINISHIIKKNIFYFFLLTFIVIKYIYRDKMLKLKNNINIKIGVKYEHNK